MKFLKIILFKNISTDFLKKTAINVDINYNKTEVGYNVILNTKIITPIDPSIISSNLEWESCHIISSPVFNM